MFAAKPPTLTIPLVEDKYGYIRIKDTRIGLDVIVYEHNQGVSPQEIVALSQFKPDGCLCDYRVLYARASANRRLYNRFVSTRRRVAPPH